MRVTDRHYKADIPPGKWITINHIGEVHVQGMDMGPLTLIAMNDETLVIKAAGHTYWTGIGVKRGYASPTTYVYAIESINDQDATRTVYKVRGLIEIDNGRKTDKTKRES